MKQALFFRIKMVVSLGFGILLVSAPTLVTVLLFGATLTPIGLLMARFVGALLLGIGFLCWRVSEMAPNPAIPTITTALLIGDAIGAFVSLLYQLEPGAYPIGRLNVGIWVAMALGLLYCRLSDSPAMAQNV